VERLKGMDGAASALPGGNLGGGGGCLCGLDGGWMGDLRETGGALDAGEEGGDEDGVEGPVC
jgi:hypothetical protein